MLTIYAWVGEDDAPGATSNVIGLKQGFVPAGMIPLAAMGHHLDRLTHPELIAQMETLAELTGKRRYLVKFEMSAIAAETEAGEAADALAQAASSPRPAAPETQIVQPKEATGSGTR